MNNRKSWFYKMLLSYLPAFFLLTSVLFLICFLAISENIKKTTIKSTQVFSEQVNQVIENFLLPIDRMITKEILIDDTFRQFFIDQKRGSYEIYQIVQKLRKLSLNFEEIDSIYVVRQSDKLVIGEHMFIDLINFYDRDFILSELEQHPSVSWTGNRVYYDQMANESRTVVSLVRRIPFLTGKQGIIIVNVRVSSIQDLVLNMSSHNTNFVNLYDREGHIIIRTEDVQNEENNTRNIEMVRVKSEYTGWELSSGIKDSEMFRFFSVFPYFWVILCFLTSLIGVLWIVYVTRRNYKPIESIMNRINEVFINKNIDLFGKGKHDEMRFIALAIDNLLEQSNKFQGQYAEDLVHIRRHLFLELVKGQRPITLAEWKMEMKRLGQEDDFDEISFSILEIDKFVGFCSNYSEKDQYLLKFVIHSIINEIAENMSIPIWSEWITNSRLG
ncbi:MAG: hypothetical protein K0S39_1328, partial [Paenibacillus sp.]|nr:hypothetical protein [Paenibacillus sp.]